MTTDTEEKLWDYAVQFDCSRGTWPSYDEPEEYVVGINASISHQREEEPSVCVGSAQAYVLKLDRAQEFSHPIFDVFDVSQELCELHGALFNTRTAELKSAIRARFEVISQDILFLSAIEIDAEHRGHGLGLATVSRFIDVWAPSEGLVVCKPFPMQFDSTHRDDSAWKRRVGAETFARSEAVATQKLTAYWKRLGFRRVANTSYAALAMTRVRPTLAMALERTEQRLRGES